jgi:hypothetical protein
MVKEVVEQPARINRNTMLDHVNRFGKRVLIFII